MALPSVPIAIQKRRRGRKSSKKKKTGVSECKKKGPAGQQWVLRYFKTFRTFSIFSNVKF